MKRAVLALGAAGLVIIIAVIISSTSKSSTALSDGNNEKSHINYDEISGAMLPETASFAGENVPLDKFYVREALDKEMQINTYWHSSTLMLLKRANRWFPEIEPILKKNNIPEDFKYLALIESGLENVVSPAGAAGFWQIMKGTAHDYGLEVNKDVDERYHLKKATQVACDYLNNAYDKFDSWTMAAASYNAGKRRINREIKRQHAGTYYDLHLNTETSRYVYRILAVKAIYETPEKFGFALEQKDLYQPLATREIRFNYEISDLAVFAKEHEVSYKMLKTLNPWLVNNILRNSTNKEYVILLPQEK